jgi:hypothetical protein
MLVAFIIEEWKVKDIIKTIVSKNLINKVEYLEQN